MIPRFQSAARTLRSTPRGRSEEASLLCQAPGLWLLARLSLYHKPFHEVGGADGPSLAITDDLNWPICLKSPLCLDAQTKTGKRGSSIPTHRFPKVFALW